MASIKKLPSGAFQLRLKNKLLPKTEAPILERASRILRRHGVPHLFMNAPLCALPRNLWPLARRSISDWKSVYADECSRCAVRADCCGLFAWHEN